MTSRVLGLLACASVLLPYQLRAQCGGAGYPVSVTALGGAQVDADFLAATARAVAHRWVTPSPQRATMPQFRRVRERTIPDIPRWADDWKPAPTHQASVVLVLRRRGRPSISQPSPRSGDALFDRSLESIVRDPMPASPILTELPASVTADTLALRINFGVASDDPAAGVIHFALSQDPVVLVQGSLNIDYQQRREVSVGQRMQSSVNVMEGFNVLVKYDVTADGAIDPASYQLLETNDRDLARAVQDGLQRARFIPAKSNCQSVRVTVIQQFGN